MRTKFAPTFQTDEANEVGLTSKALASVVSRTCRPWQGRNPKHTSKVATNGVKTVSSTGSKRHDLFADGCGGAVLKALRRDFESVSYQRRQANDVAAALENKESNPAVCGVLLKRTGYCLLFVAQLREYALDVGTTYMPCRITCSVRHMRLRRLQ